MKLRPLSVMTLLITFCVFAYTSLIPQALALEFPVADFSADPTVGPAPLIVHFTDLSTGGITDWAWDFNGDGQTDSTVQNPTFTYAEQGIYTVSLHIEGRSGDGLSGEDLIIKTDLIHVLDPSPPPPPPPNYTKKWSLPIGDVVIHSSPAVDSEGTIYIGAGSPSKLYAINPEGSVKWAYTVGGSQASPAINGDTIYIATRDGYLYAIYNNGTLKWRLLLESISHGVPAIGSDGTIYISTGNYSNPEADGYLRDGYLFAVNPDGTLKWGRSSLGLFGSPVTDSTGSVYALEYRGNELPDPGTHTAAFDPDDGQPVWRTKLSDSVDWNRQPPALSEKYIFVSAGATVYALDYGGQIGWKFSERYEPGNDCYSGISGVAVGNGIVYTGPRALSAEDGRVIWTYDDSGCVFFYGSPCLGDDGSVHVLHNELSLWEPTEVELHTINPDGTRRSILRIGSSSVAASSPVIRDGTLYVAGSLRTEDTEGHEIEIPMLHAINVESASLAETDWPCIGGNQYHTGRFEHVLPPVAGLNADVRTGRYPLTVHFSNTALRAVNGWLWDFGDGQTSTEPNPTHTYNKPGRFQVSLSVTGPMGSDSAVEPDFIKVLPGLKVLVPNGPERWVGGTWQPIRWAPAGVPGLVKIQLYQKIGSSKGKWTTLFDNEINDGYRAWLVHGETANSFSGDSTKSFIRVVSKDSPSISDQSDQSFTMEQGIRLLSPNGGEVWPIGSKRNIRWGAAVSGYRVNIYISRDSGRHWKYLYPNIVNDGQQLWTVTGPATSRARIRILNMEQYFAIGDVSERDFTIK